MTTPGIVPRARKGRSVPAATCAVLMATIVGGAWAVVPSNDTPAAATTPPAPAASGSPADTARPNPAPSAATGSAATGSAATGSGAHTTAAQASQGAPAGAATAQAAAGTAPAAPTPQPPAWADGLPPAGVAWSPYIDAAAAKEGLDPRLFASLVWAESGFDAAAVSNKGAVGLAQVMPTTAADMGVDPANPLQNLAGGARYLKKNLDRFGRADLALAAYNAGPTTVAETGGVPDIYETVEYVGKVLTLYRALSEPDAQGQ